MEEETLSQGTVDSAGNAVIPEGTKRIGDEAFISMDSLVSAVIPEGVTEIGEGAFSFCWSLSSVTLPNSLRKIGSGAFSNCDSLVSVVIPEGVTEIGVEAFDGCESLSSAVIPEGVTKIGESEFKDCYSLSSVVIGEGVTEIGESAFWGCKSLASVVIPEGVKEIGEEAFCDCESLSSVEFGGTVAQWEAVKGRQNLLEDIPAKTVKCSDGEWQKPVVLVEDGVAVKCLDENATSITIPEGVTEIGWYAFDGCWSLSSLEFGGTRAQWEEVKGRENILRYVPAKTVKCTDGEAELE